MIDLWQRLISSLLGQQRPFEARQASQDRRRLGADLSFEDDWAAGNGPVEFISNAVGRDRTNLFKSNTES
jgi:hypothetical protein